MGVKRTADVVQCTSRHYDVGYRLKKVVDLYILMHTYGQFYVYSSYSLNSVNSAAIGIKVE